MELPFDHVAIAVSSIPAALPLLELVSGGSGSPIERVEAQGVAVTFIGSGSATVELIQPISAESSVQRFLDQRGPGLHHIAYRVSDLAAELARLAQAGVRLIDLEPRPGARGHLVAFIHPESTGGVLVELVQHVPV